MAALETRDNGRAACIGAADRVVELVRQLPFPQGEVGPKIRAALLTYLERRKGVQL